MSVTSVDKDFDSLTLTLVADFDESTNLAMTDSLSTLGASSLPPPHAASKTEASAVPPVAARARRRLRRCLKTLAQ